MPFRGIVRVWHAEEGWGVIDSADTPGGCWTHCSALLVAGYAELSTGDEVTFSVEAAEQGGYRFRTVEAWPADRAPVREGGLRTLAGLRIDAELHLRDRRAATRLRSLPPAARHRRTPGRLDA